MNNFLTLLKKSVAKTLTSNTLMALIALTLLSNCVSAQSESVKLDYFSLALANQDEKPKAMFFFQEVLGMLQFEIVVVIICLGTESNFFDDGLVLLNL